jgi:putative OPT family oligopeptide transporter
MSPVLNLLAKAYGIGTPTPEHPNPLLAPQATLIASVAKGLFGGQLPWSMIVTGALIGVGNIVIDETLRIRGSTFRAPVLAAAIGIYLPLDVTMPIFLGGLLAWIAERTLLARSVQASPEEVERLTRKGMLFSAGMITGEALMGILIAVPIVGYGRADVLALPAAWQFGQWLGVIVLAVLAVLLFRTATADSQRAAPAPADSK